VQTITESEVKDMEVLLSTTEDLVTKLTGQWSLEYTQEELFDVVIRNNITKYGTIEETYDFFIYNIKELVEKSLSFWMYRLSNTYKLIRFTSFIKTLELQIYDTVEFIFADTYLATGSIKGIIQKATYNSDNKTIDYLVLLSVRAGEMDEYPFFWSADTADSYPGPKDDYAGGGV
jgi:hypothetical protein